MGLFEQKGLGRWAAIDIETTGIDPEFDQIIDIGFLQFEGTKLVKKYSSLVRYTEELSQFIQKLTGIKPSALKNAPLWREIEPELMELLGHSLLAHNADFEQNFLSPFFKKYVTENESEGMPDFVDSLYYLGLLCPNAKSLKLETFITDLELRDNEVHRGFEDSLDLLKVIIAYTYLIKEDRVDAAYIKDGFERFHMHDSFFYHFFNLSLEELKELSFEIEFDLDQTLDKYKSKLNEQKIKKEEIPNPYNNGKFEFNGESLKSIFRDQKIKERLPNFRYRASQEELALRVGQSFKNRVHSMIQAPTGTGKTLGYLIPAAVYLKSDEAKKPLDDSDDEIKHQQVLVATGTKTLQSQAMEKDVPELRKILGLSEKELSIKRLIGSSNHLCELLFRENLKEEGGAFDFKQFGEKFSDFYLDRVFQYNSRHRDDGLLREDLPYVYKMKHEEFREKDKALAVDFRACTGNRCPFAEDCTYIQGLRAAKEADIVIGNHALMFSWPQSFPRPSMIVVDEAHKLEGEVTEAFSLAVDRNQFDQLSKGLQHQQGMGSLYYLLSRYEAGPGESTQTINYLRDETKRLEELMSDQWRGLSDRVEIYFKKLPKYTSEFWNEVPMITPKSNSNDELSLSILHSFESLSFIIRSLYETILPHASRFDIKSLRDEMETVAYTRFESFLGTIEDLKMALEVTTAEGQGGYCRSLCYHEDEGFRLKAAPIDVGRILHDHLLQTSGSVVFTSATLGNASGDFGLRGMEWASGYSYLEPTKRFKSGFFLPAVYNYKDKTKVYLVDDTVAFYDRNFISSVMKELVPLLIDLGGRSLLLFSAKKRFEEAREILLDKLSGQLEVFVQGMGPRVVEDFKNCEAGVLIGMESFGEGIDVPGESLEFVFVDKVPDLRMDLVINERRAFYEANLGNEFTDYYLAHRTRSLHQKLGRLLRTESDRGAVIIVDSRIKSWKGKTMDTFDRLMLPYQMNRASLKKAADGVRDFLLN
jgi:ATP-dependent DNA helicase DinG